MLLRVTQQHIQYWFKFKMALFFSFLVVYRVKINNILLLITQSHLSIAQANSSLNASIHVRSMAQASSSFKRLNAHTVVGPIVITSGLFYW